MRKRNGIIHAVAVGAIVVALGGAALAADALEDVGGGATAGIASSSAEHASTNAQLPDVAALVINALIGGSNPSTVVAERGNSEEHRASAAKNEDEDQDVDTEDEDDDTDVEDVSHGQGLGQSGTSGTRPGWGCGDRNHEHSGPPGGPTTPPPGCAKAHHERD